VQLIRVRATKLDRSIGKTLTKQRSNGAGIKRTFDAVPPKAGRRDDVCGDYSVRYYQDSSAAIVYAYRPGCSQ
jgi:hypothetical protein